MGGGDGEKSHLFVGPVGVQGADALQEEEDQLAPGRSHRDNRALFGINAGILRRVDVVVYTREILTQLGPFQEADHRGGGDIILRKVRGNPEV